MTETITWIYNACTIGENGPKKHYILYKLHETAWHKKVYHCIQFVSEKIMFDLKKNYTGLTDLSLFRIFEKTK